jgi:hypothetical protein
MDIGKDVLRKRRTKDWRTLVWNSPKASLPPQSEFPIDGDGTKKAALSDARRCSQRELAWMSDEPVSFAGTYTEVVARYDESGIEQPFLPAVLRVRYVGRIFVTMANEHDAPTAAYVSYEDGAGRLGPMVEHIA